MKKRNNALCSRLRREYRREKRSELSALKRVGGTPGSAKFYAAPRAKMQAYLRQSRKTSKVFNRAWDKNCQWVKDRKQW